VAVDETTNVLEDDEAAEEETVVTYKAAAGQEEVLDGARTEADGAANAKGAKGDCARGCAADGDDAHAHGDGTRADGSLDAEGDGAAASEGDGAADAEADCATEHAEALVEDEGGAECIGR
jgi:hypothetical protein